MRIISLYTDPEHSKSGFCWANVAAGHISSIYSSVIREDGKLWPPGFDHRSPVEVMKELAEDWPGFYKKVRKEAFRDELPDLMTVMRDHKMQDVSCVKDSIARLEKKLKAKKAKLKKIERG